MSDKTFNFIRFLAEVLISAIGAFYYAIADIWGLPYGAQIVATCAAISTFLGIFTQWQRARYNEGIGNDEEAEEEALDVHIEREEIE